MPDRINRKLDLIMEKLGIDASEFKPKPAPRAAKLSAADQQAIDNAPKTPTGASGPVGSGPRVDAATNAPVTPTPPVPPGAEVMDDDDLARGKPPVKDVLPWPSYDSDSEEAIIARLRNMEPSARNKALQWERKNKNRASITRVNWNS